MSKAWFITGASSGIGLRLARFTAHLRRKPRSRTRELSETPLLAEPTLTVAAKPRFTEGKEKHHGYRTDKNGRTASAGPGNLQIDPA